MTNVTISEFGMRQVEKNGQVVISYCNHKTTSQGLAQLMVTKDGEELLMFYLEKVDVKITPATDVPTRQFVLFFNGNLHL